ncbi:MAG: thioredoxin family protein [Saprospiraceae bacterium]
MKVIRICNIATFALFVSHFTLSAQISPTKIGNIISDFELSDTENKVVSLKNYSDAKGLIVVFTCNHCPFAKLYTERFNDLNTKYKAQDVPLIAINSMDTLVYEEESFALMQKKARKEHFNFPYLYDFDQTAGKIFSADKTPHAFVVWKENNMWVIRYSGAIDDNGEEPEKATSFLANAVDDLLKNKPVAVPETESFGCKIFYRK